MNPIAVPLANDNPQTLRLYAETVSVGKTQTRETVRVSTQTTTRDVLVEEDVRRKDVTVERVPIGRYVDSMPLPHREGDVTILPVVEEEIVVTKRLFLREEVHLRQTETITNHVETVTLREQHAIVTRVPEATSTEPTA